MGDWVTPIREPIQTMAVKMWGYVPNIIAAIVILLVGVLVSKILADIIVRLLKLSKLDVAAEKSGLANMMRMGEIKAALSEVLGTLIYWALILMVAATAAQALKFTAAMELIARLIAYIPNIISAVLILAAGTFVASFLGSLVLTATKNAGVKKANLLTQLVKTVLIIFSIAIAIEQLKIGTAIITQVVSVIVLSLGAGFAIAFGLGCKDIVARGVNDFLNKLK
jgi:hypothetical protein